MRLSKSKEPGGWMDDEYGELRSLAWRYRNARPNTRSDHSARDGIERAILKLSLSGKTLPEVLRVLLELLR